MRYSLRRLLSHRCSRPAILLLTLPLLLGLVLGCKKNAQNKPPEASIDYARKDQGMTGLSLSSAPLFTSDAPLRDVAVADFNHDGILDLGLATASGLSYLKADAPGHYALVKKLVPGDVSSLVAADLSGDNFPDIAYVSQGVVSILVNDGTGRFTDRTLALCGQKPPATSIFAADWDLDGHDDLVCGKSVYLFSGGKLSPASASPAQEIASLADFNGDGRPDPLLVDGSAWLNIGDKLDALGTLPGLEDKSKLPSNLKIHYLTTDVTGDKLAEVLAWFGDASSTPENDPVILRHKNEGGRSLATPELVGKGFRFLAAGQFNSDDKADLVTFSLDAGNKLVLLLGDNAGRFTAGEVLSSTPAGLTGLKAVSLLSSTTSDLLLWSERHLLLFSRNAGGNYIPSEAYGATAGSTFQRGATLPPAAGEAAQTQSLLAASATHNTPVQPTGGDGGSFRGGLFHTIGKAVGSVLKPVGEIVNKVPELVQVAGLLSKGSPWGYLLDLASSFSADSAAGKNVNLGSLLGAAASAFLPQNIGIAGARIPTSQLAGLLAGITAAPAPATARPPGASSSGLASILAGTPDTAGVPAAPAGILPLPGEQQAAQQYLAQLLRIVLHQNHPPPAAPGPPPGPGSSWTAALLKAAPIIISLIQ